MKKFKMDQVGDTGHATRFSLIRWQDKTCLNLDEACDDSLFSNEADRYVGNAVNFLVTADSKTWFSADYVEADYVLLVDSTEVVYFVGDTATEFEVTEVQFSSSLSGGRCALEDACVWFGEQNGKGLAGTEEERLLTLLMCALRAWLGEGEDDEEYSDAARWTEEKRQRVKAEIDVLGDDDKLTNEQVFYRLWEQAQDDKAQGYL